jgi:hypothetical protein
VRLDQHHQKVECAAAKIDGLLIYKKLACARQYPKSPKSNGGVTPAVSHLARHVARRLGVMHRLVPELSPDQLLLHDNMPPLSSVTPYFP